MRQSRRVRLAQPLPDGILPAGVRLLHLDRAGVLEVPEQVLPVPAHGDQAQPFHFDDCH